MIGFLLHNVTEGPTIIAAIARNAETPPIRHLAVVGALAGETVIVGGWIGSLLVSPIVASVLFAVALASIAQVILGAVHLIRVDAGAIVTRPNATTFVLGVGLSLLEDVIAIGLQNGRFEVVSCRTNGDEGNHHRRSRTRVRDG